MPQVKFDELRVHQTYSRPELASLWTYAGYQALARGVVPPSGQPYIILFVTVEKQAFQEQYSDRLEGDRLYWEGPTDHFAEDRMIASPRTQDEIHVFYRARHHSYFEYLGRANIVESTPNVDRPSSFVFHLPDV